jgi:hypothetical protein
VDGVTSYLAVRAADGAILAEFQSPESALKALLQDEELGGPNVYWVRFHDNQGEIVGTTSFVTVSSAGLRG